MAVRTAPVLSSQTEATSAIMKKAEATECSSTNLTRTIHDINTIYIHLLVVSSILDWVFILTRCSI